MHNDDLHHFFESAKAISLTSAERNEIKRTLVAARHSSLGSLSLEPEEKAAFRDELVLAMRGTVPLSAQEESTSFFFRWPLVFRFPVLACFIFLFAALSGKGLMAASESALPGDALYPVKLYLSEGMVSTFLRTPEAQAAWAMMTMERRLDEIRQKSEQDLTDADDEAYAKLLEQYAKNADAQVSRVTTHTAEALREEMETTLATEERRLIRQAELRPSRHMLQTVKELREEAEKRRMQNRPIPTIDETVHPAASSSSTSFSASGSTITDID